MTRSLPAVLLTPEDYKAIFSGFPDEGWKSFYAKYPDAYGLITVSRVGLNRDRTATIFYISVEHGPLNGYGQHHVLRKEDDAWVEVPVKNFQSWTA